MPRDYTSLVLPRRKKMQEIDTKLLNTIAFVLAKEDTTANNKNGEKDTRGVVA